MDFADILLNRINNEVGMKKNNNALLCFSELETGKILNKIGIQITRSKMEKSAITLLYFISKEKEAMFIEGEKNEYKHNIIDNFIPSEEKDKVTLRLFIESSNNHYADIIRVAEEQNTDFILLGINTNELAQNTIKRFSQFKSDPSCSDSFILEQFNEKEALTLKTINALFNRDTGTTGFLINNGLTKLKKIFVPILHKSDIYTFAYLYKIALFEEVKIMVWDAIGIISSDAKIQKLYQTVLKKTEGRFSLWNNDRKIGCDFINEQDLIVTGTKGWSKLINTPLQWNDCLPSTLIIKEQAKFNEI